MDGFWAARLLTLGLGYLVRGGLAGLAGGLGSLGWHVPSRGFSRHSSAYSPVEAMVMVRFGKCSRLVVERWGWWWGVSRVCEILNGRHQVPYASAILVHQHIIMSVVLWRLLRCPVTIT